MATAINNNDMPSNLADVIRPVPLVEEKLYQIPVATGSLMIELARATFQAIDMIAVSNLPVTSEDFVEAYQYVLAARCAYASGLVKTADHPKDIQYPSFLFPVLAKVGRYTDTFTNIRIIPVPEIGYQDIVTLGEDGKLSFNEKKRITKPEKFDAVIAVLRAYGVNIAFGLPMDRDVEDDEIYRLEEVEGALRGSKQEPSSHSLYARALLELQYLASLYGEARVQYVAISSLKTGVYELIARQVRGPSRRSSG